MLSPFKKGPGCGEDHVPNATNRGAAHHVRTFGPKPVGVVINTLLPSNDRQTASLHIRGGLTMTVCLIGVHYPRADYFSEFVKTVRKASDRLLGTPGCVSAEWWITTDQESVVSVAHFTSDAAVSSARVKVRESNLADGYDERICQPPQIVIVEAGD